MHGIGIVSPVAGSATTLDTAYVWTLPNTNHLERRFDQNAERPLDIATPNRDPLALHSRLPGYTATPLIELPRIAAELGLDRLWLKDESSRLGLPAFKILGASWATVRALDARLTERTGHPTAEWATLDDLAAQLGPLRPLTLACATDGNHGRAVARMACWLGLEAHILVPAHMAPARVAAIRSEGAHVSTIDGTYDDAVDAAANLAAPECLVISDTAWPGYEDIPTWVIEGYSTIFWEVDDALGATGEPGPDLVLAQIGVGALAAAVARHYRREGLDPSPRIVGVEPTRAACALTSMEAGERVALAGPHDSIMSGLNCGVPSSVAWPFVSRGIDTFLAVDDERARRAMRALATEGVVAGECGAAGLAGLTAFLEDEIPDPRPTRALIVSTEGATDPAAYRQILAAGS